MQQNHSPELGQLRAENAALRERVAALEAELAASRAMPIRAAGTDLQSTDPFLAAVLEQLPVGVSIAAVPSGQLLFHNAEAVRLLRHPLLTSTDYTGYAQYGALHPDGRPYAPEEYPIARALLHQTVVRQEEMIYRRGDGTITIFAVSAAPIRDAAGQLIAVVSTFQDISQRRQLEIALRESERRFAAAFMGSPVALVLTTAADGTILDVNERFLALFKRARADAIGQRSTAIGMWNDPSERGQVLEVLHREGRIRDWQVTIRDAGDRPRHVLLSIESLAIDDTPCLLTAIYDMTDRVRAEAALHESEERFHHTIDRLLEGVQIIGFDWRYRYLNDSAVAQARQPRAALLGRTMMECYPGIETTELFRALQRCMDERVAIRMENRFDYGDGTVIWFDLSIQPGPEGIVVLSVDSSARKRVEQDLQYAADRLQLLADASRAFAEMGVGLEALLGRIARITGEQLVAACVIRLLSDDEQRLEAVTIYDRDPAVQHIAQAALTRAPIGMSDPSPSAIAIRDSQPQFLHLVDPAGVRSSVSPEAWSAFEQFQPISAIVVPLYARGRNIGVLSYIRHEPGQQPFAEDDVTLAQDLADRAALAIGNAQLYAVLQQTNAELERRVAARTAELRQRTDLIDLASDAIIIRDFATDTVIYWNHGAERLYGWPSAEIAGQHVHTVLQTVFPMPLAEIKATLLRADVWEGELVQRRRDGQRVDVASRWTVERDQDGRPATLLAINTDISGRKHMEAQLRQHAARATALAEIARALAEIGLDDTTLFETIAQCVSERVGGSCSVALCSADGLWLETKGVFHPDAGALALLRELAAAPFPVGAGLAGQVARTGAALRLADISPEQASVQANANYQRYFDRYGMAHLLIVPLRAHGQIVGTLGVSRGLGEPPYTDEDQSFLQHIADHAALAIDHVRMFAEAQQARAAAEQANRAKSVFLTSLSHELRTPLNAIIGFTGTLLMQLPGPLTVDQERQLSTVQRSAKHLLALINDLLDLAKIESGKVEISRSPVVCQDAIAAVAAAMRPLAEQKGLRFVVETRAEPVVVFSDERALSQILLNLVGNAIKFTDRGEVVVSLKAEGRRMKDEAEPASSFSLHPSSFILFSVRDTGIGIKPEDQERLFQEFGRVNSAEVRAREGTGLGLRLSHRLAELLGGQIAVESEYGVGSTFTLVLPGDRSLPGGSESATHEQS